MEFILGVIVVAALYLLLKSALGRAHPEGRADSSTNRRRLAIPSGPTFHWNDDGNFDFEVVGESHYQENLRKLAGNHDEYGANMPCPAFLVPDDDNPYDNKAVGVFINGLKVGHLSREDARSFRRRLGSKKLTGHHATPLSDVGDSKMAKGFHMAYGST